jgi:hypothetical protein
MLEHLLLFFVGEGKPMDVMPAFFGQKLELSIYCYIVRGTFFFFFEMDNLLLSI